MALRRAPNLDRGDAEGFQGAHGHRVAGTEQTQEQMHRTYITAAVLYDFHLSEEHRSARLLSEEVPHHIIANGPRLGMTPSQISNQAFALSREISVRDARTVLEP